MHNKLKNLILDNLLGAILSVLTTGVISYFLPYYIIIASSFWLFLIILVIVSFVVYLLYSYIVNKYLPYELLKNKYSKPIISGVIASLIYIIINSFLIIDQIDYSKTDISFIQNIPNKNITAIIKNNGTFLLNKNPQMYHPYMGILSFGKFQTDRRFLIEMEGKLNGESQIGIVLLENGKMPTEYIELLASTTTDNIALNDVDGKGKNNFEKESVPLYEGQKFKLFMDYKKYENKACIYYNSIYSKLFNEKCINLPSNIDLKFIGFKIVDDDVSNNNLSVPEISKFIVHSLRY